MKKLISLLLALVMVISLAACGGGGEASNDPSKTTESPKETEAPTEHKGFDVQTITSGDFEITVLGAELIKGMKEVPAIRIYYQFKNNASYTAKGVDDLTLKVTQNGEAIGTVFPIEGIKEDDNKEYYIRPGATIRCTSVRELADETTPVVFVIGDYSAAEKLEVEFDLTALPGAPADAFEIAPVVDPQSLVGLAAEGTLDEKYGVKILGVEKTADRSGNDALVVHYSFTNNSEKEVSFNSAVKAKVFQDGIQLRPASPADSQSPAYKMRTEKCAPGTTVEVDLYFVLISTSPCEVEVCDSHISRDTDEYFEERIGLIFTVE